MQLGDLLTLLPEEKPYKDHARHIWRMAEASLELNKVLLKNIKLVFGKAMIAGFDPDQNNSRCQENVLRGALITFAAMVKFQKDAPDPYSSDLEDLDHSNLSNSCTEAINSFVSEAENMEGPNPLLSDPEEEERPRPKQKHGAKGKATRKSKRLHRGTAQ